MFPVALKIYQFYCHFSRVYVDIEIKAQAILNFKSYAFAAYNYHLITISEIIAGG